MTKSLILTLEDDGTYTILIDETNTRYFSMPPEDVEIFLNDFLEQHQPIPIEDVIDFGKGRLTCATSQQAAWYQG